MALSYYTDPRSGTRTTRDTLARLRRSAESRVAKWSGVANELYDRIDRATPGQRRSGWVSRWQNELRRAERLAGRAEGDKESLDRALEKGDGRGKTWRYRMSFNYTESKKTRSDTLQVDVLMRKKKGERASGREARAAFYQYLRGGEAPPEWKVEQVSWFHDVEKFTPDRKTVRKVSPARSVSDAEGMYEHVKEVFGKVIGEDTESGVQEIETEDLARPAAKKRPHRKPGRPKGVAGPNGWHLTIGEEDEDE